jgi:hypothetical protein
MRFKRNELSDLAFRAKLGDRAAGQALHQAVDPHMRLLVREALRCKSGPFAQQVSVVVGQIAANCRWVSTPEQFIELLARRMSASIKDGCTAVAPCSHWSKDTVPNDRTV